MEKRATSEMISQSDKMKFVFNQVSKLASFKTTILITGESGTGKELLAKRIHRSSPRADKPFIPINCGAIPENLVESELFGHLKGSFTDASSDKIGLFEEANGGTIFLDEVGELPLHLQVKLLRVLQESEIRPIGDRQSKDIDVRVIAATHKNLEQEVQAGNFREDLLYRLNVVTLPIPALRERQGDIPVLVHHFVRKFNKKLDLKIDQVSKEAMQILEAHHWKGNVRELENCLERAMVLTLGTCVKPNVLPDAVKPQTETSHGNASNLHFDDRDLSIKSHVRKLETALIAKALDKTGGNRTKAAKLLEISHRTLLYKLKEYELTQYRKA